MARLPLVLFTALVVSTTASQLARESVAIDAHGETIDFSDAAAVHTGKMLLPDGTVYQGNFKHGRFEGFGTASSPNGLTYSGAFRDGKPSGRGTLLSDGKSGAKQVLYEGSFEDGFPSGDGVMFRPDESEVMTVDYKGRFDMGKAPERAPAATHLALEKVSHWAGKVFSEAAVPHSLDEECGPHNMVWNLASGRTIADSEKFLGEGSCVVALEENPARVAEASASLSPWLDAGRLHLVHATVAAGPGGSDQAYWMSTSHPEANSFSQEKGCAGSDDCEKTFVSAVPCRHLFERFGVPHYAKLDAGESGCLSELLARKKRGESVPNFVSGEVSAMLHANLEKAGYSQFKLVRKAVDGASGYWGDDASDCRSGAEWRDFSSVSEDAAHLQDHSVDSECPRKSSHGTIVYELHASIA